MFAHHQAVARSLVLAVLLPLTVAGCVTADGAGLADAVDPGSARSAAINSGRFKVDAVNLSAIDPRFLRQTVDYRTAEPPGTIVVDPHNRFPSISSRRAAGPSAMASASAVPASNSSAPPTSSSKREWPHWTRTPAMIAREPKRYAKWARGMDGGEGNPLGARALYLFKDGRDTRYRIHGTTELESIGKAVSSGCIRMMNQD